MNKKELRQLFFLNRELVMWKKELEKLEQSTLIAAMPLFGISCVGKRKRISAKKISDEINSIKNKIEEIQDKIRKQRCKLQYFINDVPDSYIRQILFYRYVMFLSWTAVAVSVGGNNNADTVRVAHDRYLKKCFKTSHK